MDQIKHAFTIPQNLHREGVAKALTMREPSATDEVLAAKTPGGAGAFAAVKNCIVELDGKKVEQAGVEVEQFWSNCGPKVRSLLMNAYLRLFSADEEETQAFFGSQVTSV